MSRSYNRWKELIQEFFEEEPEAEVSILMLIIEITDDEIINYKDDWDKIHNSVCRTVRKLEKEGYLEHLFYHLNGVRNLKNIEHFKDIVDEDTYKPTKIKIVRRKMGIHRIGVEWEIEQKGYNIFEII